jgi:serine/threonine-protein kinase
MAKDILDIGGFTIKRRIGSGARSAIYEAIDEQGNTPVALKRVIYEKPEDTRVFEQVENEFKNAQRIDHPYVRKCYTLKKIRSMFKVKELLLSMELFDGVTLEEHPNLSMLDVLLVFRMVANGLNAMHQHGYVHCDIKPNNILLNKNGSIKIIDLGQSCKIGTIKRRIQGTPDYIAPEQVKREPLGPKTDVFNLGATMYWALTGKNVPTLIPKKDTLDVLLKQPLKSPHEIKPQISEPISNLVMDCVKEDPTKRPKNMLEVMLRLDVLIHDILRGTIKTKNSQEQKNSG